MDRSIAASRLKALKARYREFALAARLSASTSDSRMADEYIKIAEHCEQLAREAAEVEAHNALDD
jgi:hypothetical protein